MHNHETFNAFKSIRKGGLIPASLALRQLRHQQAMMDKAKQLDFSWQGRYTPEFAKWKQAGFDLTAHVMDDPDGWGSYGRDHLGYFTDRWEVGAIPHWIGDRRSYKWFIPAGFADRHQAYSRACDYGDSWSYIGLRVTVSRHQTILAEADLFGIESDADAWFLTETALDLAASAIPDAEAKLKALCTCQPSEPTAH